MAYGNKYRLDAIARPKDPANDLAAVFEWAVSPAFLIRLGIVPDQSRFGASDGREIQQQPQMACEPETARMRQPLAVANQCVGATAQPAEDANQRGDFAE